MNEELMSFIASLLEDTQFKILKTYYRISKWCERLCFLRQLKCRHNLHISFDLDDGVVKNYALFGNVLANLK